MSGARGRVLEEFNASTLDSVGPFGGDQGMNVLQEMNELGEAQEHIRRESSPKASVYQRKPRQVMPGLSHIVAGQDLSQKQ
jgi:uncharacterized protein YfeS